MNVRKPLIRSLSNRSICTYFSNTQIVLGLMRYLEIRRGNKNTLGEINVLTNAMAKKPFYHQVIPYFSSLKVVMEPTFRELMTSPFFGKSLYLGSIVIAKPILTFRSKINIYFPRFKAAMGPISLTFARYKLLEHDVCR